jgi:hypothetical protein
VIPSPAVFCLPQCLSICLLQILPSSVLVDESCTVLDLSYLVDESSLYCPVPQTDPLKVALGVLARGHFVELFIFPYFHAHDSLVVARTKLS